MSLAALVLANTEPANHRVAYAITRELRRLPGVNFSVKTNLKDAMDNVARGYSDYSLIIADGPTIGNDFKAAAGVLPNRPLILLKNADTALNDNQARQLGIDPALVVNRPFVETSLTKKVEAVLHDQLSPPKNLRGLFTNKACTNVFFDGRPLEGLMSVERDLLVFLVNNKTENMPLDKMVQRFRETTPGMLHYEDDGIARILEMWSGKLAKTVPALTDGTYNVARQQDKQTQRFTGCSLVCRAA